MKLVHGIKSETRTQSFTCSASTGSMYGQMTQNLATLYMCANDLKAFKHQFGGNK